MFFRRQAGDKGFGVVGIDRLWRLTVHEGLKFAQPDAVRFQRAGGIMAQLNLFGQFCKFVQPTGGFVRCRRPGTVVRGGWFFTGIRGIFRFQRIDKLIKERNSMPGLFALFLRYVFQAGQKGRQS